MSGSNDEELQATDAVGSAQPATNEGLGVGEEGS